MALNKAERSALALVLRERAKSNASGVHNNKASKRSRTRSAGLSKAVREGLENA